MQCVGLGALDLPSQCPVKIPQHHIDIEGQTCQLTALLKLQGPRRPPAPAFVGLMLLPVACSWHGGSRLSLTLEFGTQFAQGRSHLGLQTGEAVGLVA